MYCSDGLAGTSVYGDYVNSTTVNANFSIPFTVNANKKLLFMTGDQSAYLHVKYGSISSPTNSADGRSVLKKSITPLASSLAGLRTVFELNALLMQRFRHDNVLVRLE